MLFRNKTLRMLLLMLLTATVNKQVNAQNAAGSPVSIQVDLSKEVAAMEPVWAWFGYDEPNYTTMKDGQKLLTELSALSPVLVPVQPYSDIHTGWRYPPKDYAKWGELIYQWVKYSVERYGKKEVESWYWELSNCPIRKSRTTAHLRITRKN